MTTQAARTVALAALIGITLAPAARAEVAEFALIFKGMQAGVLSLTLTRDKDRYRAQVGLRSTGVAAMLKRIRIDAQAQGRLTARGPVAERYQETVDTGRRQSDALLVWEKGLPRLLRYAPMPDPAPWDVDPATQKGSVDPLTGFATALAAVPPGRECNLTRRMFDGRRASEVRLGPPAPAADGQVTCPGEYRRLAGFSPDEMAEKTRFPFAVTYAPAPDGQMQVVQVTLDTLYGKAHLKRQ